MGITPERIAVLGAGYAGLSAFLELQERAVPAGADLTLVDRNPYHTFTTEIHTIAGGDEDEEDVRVQLDRIVRPPARLRLGAVERLDWSADRPRVRMAEGESVEADWVVLAVGYEPEYYGIPGMREHSHVLADLASAVALRRKLESLARERPDAEVVLVGGGLTGVELAGEMAETYPGLHLTLVEGGPDIMPGFEPALVHAARHHLESAGVHIRTGTRITRARQREICLQPSGGGRANAGRAAGPPRVRPVAAAAAPAGAEPAESCLRFDLLIWAGGIRGSRIVAASGLDTNAKGQGRVDGYLRGQLGGRSLERVFLAGDCSAPYDPASARPVPPTAQTALQEGRVAGRNLLRAMRGEALTPFTPRMRGLFVSLGPHTGVGRLGHATLYGVPAIAIKHLIEAHHAYDAGGLAKLLGRVVHAHHEPESSPERQAVSTTAP
jgi:NADH dehydrogenase